MYYRIVLSLIIIFFSILVKAGDTTYFKVGTKPGYVIGFDSSSSNWYVIKIYQISALYTTEIPCKNVYRWVGKNKDSLGSYSYKLPDSSSNSSETFVSYSSKYKGDSIIDTNCKSSMEGSIVRYYLPSKNKNLRFGEEYFLKSNEHFTDINIRPNNQKTTSSISFLIKNYI